jgi:hypothetical protein
VSDAERASAKELQRDLAGMSGVRAVEVFQENGLDTGHHNNLTVAMDDDASADEISAVVAGFGERARKAGLDVFRLTVRVAPEVDYVQDEDDAPPPSADRIGGLLADARDGGLSTYLTRVTVGSGPFRSKTFGADLRGTDAARMARALDVVRDRGWGDLFGSWAVESEDGLRGELDGRAVDQQVTVLWHDLATARDARPDGERAWTVARISGRAPVDLTVKVRGDDAVRTAEFGYAEHGPALWPLLSGLIGLTRADAPLILTVARDNPDDYSRPTVLFRIEDGVVTTNAPQLGWDAPARDALAG